MKIICCLLLLPMALFAQPQTGMTIHFDFNKAVIRPADAGLLDSLVTRIMTATGTAGITIRGHCDGRGTGGYNDTLSVKRAKAVAHYLLVKGLPGTMIRETSGYGSSQPINDEHNEPQRAENRRVELLVDYEEQTIAGPPQQEALKPVETAATPKDLVSQLEDSTIKTGSSIILANMNFAGGTHHLLNSSYKTLQELLTALKRNMNLEIQVQGHICCVPGAWDGLDMETRTYNLSEERAKAIYTYLVNSGIAAARLSYKGFGHSKPIYPYPERSEQERILNRRVEIKIRKR